MKVRTICTVGVFAISIAHFSPPVCMGVPIAQQDEAQEDPGEFEDDEPDDDGFDDDGFDDDETDADPPNGPTTQPEGQPPFNQPNPTAPANPTQRGATQSPVSRSVTGGGSALTQTGSNVTIADARAALKLHNDARRAVGSPPLQWSAELSAIAQQWANRLASEGRLDHDSNTSQGENLAQATGGLMDAAQGTRDWLSEKTQHYDQGRVHPQAGHYTQAVWQKTTKVGIGIAKRGATTVVVARYTPAGNTSGQPPFPGANPYP